MEEFLIMISNHITQNKKRLSILDSLYSIHELSRELNISTRTLYNYVLSGRLQGVKIGRSWFFSEQNILNFVSGAEGNIHDGDNSRL